jgi:hypothetical protein
MKYETLPYYIHSMYKRLNESSFCSRMPRTSWIRRNCGDAYLWWLLQAAAVPAKSRTSKMSLATSKYRRWRKYITFAQKLFSVQVASCAYVECTCHGCAFAQFIPRTSCAEHFYHFKAYVFMSMVHLHTFLSMLSACRMTQIRMTYFWMETWC